MNTAPLLAKYNTWANQQIFNMCSTLNDDEYRLDRGAFFGSIHQTLNHILLVDRLWIGRMVGDEDGSIRSLDQELYEDMTELQQAQAKSDKRLKEYVEDLDEEQLNKPFDYCRLADGEPSSTSIQEALSTLFNHQTHHRGQIHAMLTQAGIANSDMPDMDIVDYLKIEKSEMS